MSTNKLNNNIFLEPTADWSTGHSLKDTLWRWLKGAPQTRTVKLTAAEIKALATTQIELVPAPGADKFIEFVGAILILDNDTNYDDAATQGDLQITYTNGDGVAASDAIESEGFIDCTADTITSAVPVKDAIVAASACVDQALVLDNSGAEFTTGTGTMTVKITYIIHDAELA